MADITPARIAEFIAPFWVKPGRRVRLAQDFDPSVERRRSKEEIGDILDKGVELLAEYQARLAAQDTYALLVCFQAMDAAGKDGTIRHVMSGVNPQGVEVSSFKVPSAEELDHDYLWRYARRLPARGHIGIFNRSHYEEMLVVRVHPEVLARQQLPPSARKGDIWKRRFREVNDWERYLTDNGYRIVKIFLNVSKEEQRQRFLARIEEPDKNWKFSAADVRERRFWDEYQKAYSEVLSNTSTAWAPWYVIPADDKPLARVAAAGIIANALIEIDPRYPVMSEEARQALLDARVELEAEGTETARSAPAGVTPVDKGGKRDRKKNGKR
jgi:PPK2 family polyphosphate:nucleotide phosphotransferase